jgi:hypothetical protein
MPPAYNNPSSIYTKDAPPAQNIFIKNTFANNLNSNSNTQNENSNNNSKTLYNSTNLASQLEEINKSRKGGVSLNQ